VTNVDLRGFEIYPSSNFWGLVAATKVR